MRLLLNVDDSGSDLFFRQTCSIALACNTSRSWVIHSTCLLSVLLLCGFALAFIARGDSTKTKPGWFSNCLNTKNVMFHL